MRRALLAALVLFAAATARAAFEEMGAGARAPALGDAFTALADDVYAIHYNPAGLAQLERPQLGAAYSRLYSGLSDGSEIGTSQLAYAHPLSRGKLGTIGASWERFSVSSLYAEQSLAFAYGRRVAESRSGGALSLGGSLKYLHRSFTRTAEAGTSCSSGLCNGGADPLLSGPNSKGVPDLDLGVLYRFPRRFQVGLAITHLTSPDVGFSGGDRVERGIALGGAFKSLWLSLIGELKMRKAADGATARDMIFAAERYFPTLDYGQFGLRGSLGLGTGDWRQLGLGGSYRVNKVQADYAYLVPVGPVKGQSGAHRVGLTFHFGAPSADEEMGRELLEQARKIRQTGPSGYGYEYEREMKPDALEDPRVADVRGLIAQRRYRAAHRTLADLATVQPLGPALEKLLARLDLVGYHYAEIPELKTRHDKALADSAALFLKGEDRKAVLHASYAHDLGGREDRTAKYLETLEKETRQPPLVLPAGHPRVFLDELLWRAEFAHARGDAGEVERNLSDLLELEPENATALERLGSQHYLAGRFVEAIKAWEAALKIETREREVHSMKEYLKLAREQAAAKTLPGGVPKAATLSPLEPAKALERARDLELKLPERRGDPREVEGLYQKGVEFYARGEYLQASAMFLRILQIDPDNELARKALERIDRRRAR